MRYDKNGRMIGYDAMEKLTRGMPAGVPIAMVMQYFVHDQEGTARSSGQLHGVSTYSQLGDKRRGLKKIHSHTLSKGLSKEESNRSNIGICWRCYGRCWRSIC